MTLFLKKIREFRTDYNNRPSDSISFIPVVDITSGHFHCELVLIFFLQDHRETETVFRFFRNSDCSSRHIPTRPLSSLGIPFPRSTQCVRGI